MLGAMAGVLLMAAYMAGGMMIIRCLLPRVRLLARIWLGAALGVILEMWLPYLCAYLWDFTLTAQLFSLLPLAGLCGLSMALRDHTAPAGWDEREKRLLILLACAALPLTLIGGYLQITHTICPAADGSLHVGQSTYGDLNLHLGIATSFCNAKVPVDYSIFPGEPLTYPFLTDSLSATFLLLGGSLQFSIVFPGTVMMALVFSGYILLAERMAGSRRAALLAGLLFFINGGLGFLYSLDMAGVPLGSYESNELQSVSGLLGRLRIILDGWYQTPANHAEFTTYNLRWSNVIADMLVPQRTTLGGWCQLIPCLYLVYELAAGSRFEKAPASGKSNIRLIVLAGIWAGMLPMVHTHSFLALGLVCAGWLIWDWLDCEYSRRARRIAAGCLILTAVLLALLQCLPQLVSLFDSDAVCDAVIIPATVWLALAAAAVMSMVLDLVLTGRDTERIRRITRWLLFGGITVLLAAPQLFSWTFSQAGGSDHFLAFQFNWVNNSSSSGLRDGYLWFYIKNVGLPFLLLLISLLEKDEKTRFIACGAFTVFLTAEFIRFQPNEYDNNKLFYVWYMLCAILAARYAVKLFDRLKGLRGRYALAVLACVLFFSTGTLSIARECVSDYQTFSAEDVKAADFIRENTEEHAVFITWTEHINPVSALSGRSIVCGPDLWLYWHGFNTWERQSDLRAFYSDPAGSASVAEKYGAEYIYVGPYERSELDIDDGALAENYELIYEGGGYSPIRIYRIGP